MPFNINAFIKEKPDTEKPNPFMTPIDMAPFKVAPAKVDIKPQINTNTANTTSAVTTSRFNPQAFNLKSVLAKQVEKTPTLKPSTLSPKQREEVTRKDISVGIPDRYKKAVQTVLPQPSQEELKKSYEEGRIAKGNVSFSPKGIINKDPLSGRYYTVDATTAAGPLKNVSKTVGTGLAKAVAGQADDVAAVANREFVNKVNTLLPGAKATSNNTVRNTAELAQKAVNYIKENPLKAELVMVERLKETAPDDKTVALGSELLKKYFAEAGATDDQIIKSGIIDKANKLATELSKKLTEAGRAGQAASILSKITPEGKLMFAAREIQKYNDAVEKNSGLFGLKKKVPELTPQVSQHILERMTAIQGMEDGAAKAMELQKLNKFIRNMIPSSLADKIVTVWKAGLLTGVKTTGVNISSNLANLTAEKVKDIPATMVDKVVSLFTGKRTKSLITQGLPGGTWEGIKKGVRYLGTGYDERDIATKLDLDQVNFGKGKLAGALQSYTDTVFKVLGAEDQPFYYAAKLNSLADQAKVMAINQGLKGQAAKAFMKDLVESPTNQMIKLASQDAEAAVFQNPTLLGKIAKSIQNLGPLGKVVVPFGRTPAAVATQIFNYTPAGAVKTIIQNIGKGKFDQRQLAEGLGRAITGSGILAIGMELYKKGLMNTSYPTGEKEQKLWEAEGRTPNSIKINGEWKSVQALGPVGNALLIGGSFAKAFRDSGSRAEAITKGLADSVRSFTQQAFVTNVNKVLEALADPERNAKNFIQGLAGSIVPTLVSDVGRAIDTNERRIESPAEAIKARIPGVRETLESKVDIVGNEIPRVGGVFDVMANPLRPSPEKGGPTVQEFRRLWDAGYKVSPTAVGDKTGYKSISQEQNTQMWKDAGKEINEFTELLLTKNEYKKADDETKVKLIERIIEKSKVDARAKILADIIVNTPKEELKDTLQKLKEDQFATDAVLEEALNIVPKTKKKEPTSMVPKESIGDLFKVKEASAASVNVAPSPMEAAKNIKDIGEWNKYIQSLHSDNVKFFEGRKNAKNNVTPAQPTAKGAYPVDTGTTTPVPAVRKLKENGKLVSKTINTNNVDELIDAYKVTPEGKKKYGGPIKSIGGLDLQTVQYATNPDHMKSLRSIYADVKDFDYNQMQAEFKRLGSPLQYISGSLAKALEHYGLTPGEFIAVVRQDSRAGTSGRRAIENKNPGNVGNVDNGSNLKFSTWLEGSVAAMRNLAERKVEG